MTGVVLRQVALVAESLAPVASRLQRQLGLPAGHRDPGVQVFGLENLVYEVGRSFLEIVSPAQPGTTAGRLLEKRGTDGGYMAIFQVPDVGDFRARAAALGVRTIWSADLADMAGTHLHPKDVPGAIVSLDWAHPPESWRWAGPRWTGGAPPEAAGGLTALTVAVADPSDAAERWAAVLGVAPDGEEISLDGGGQHLRFVAATGPSAEGIVEAVFAVPRATPGEVHVGDTGVRIERQEESR